MRYINLRLTYLLTYLLTYMALTRPSLITQSTSGVSVLAHMCEQKADTLSNCCDIFSHMTRDVSVFVKCDTIFGLFF